MGVGGVCRRVVLKAWNSILGEDEVDYVKSSFLQLYEDSQTSPCLLPLLGLLLDKNQREAVGGCPETSRESFLIPGTGAGTGFPEVQLTGGKAGEVFSFDTLACRTTSVADLGVFPEFGIFTWIVLVEVKGTSTMPKFDIQNERFT